ncbi:MAG: DUF4097 family beta strand repeat-containing protein [Gammaproteobacteria bacterium]
MKHRHANLFFLLSALIALEFAGAAWADAPVTRTLYQMIAVPAGGTVKVENLVGHMTVIQDSGSLRVSTVNGAAVLAQEMLGRSPLRVTATVVASGSQAQALAQSVKLEVSTSGKQITVHVHYPVDQYRSYLYNPPRTTGNGNGNHCFLGFVCVRGNGHSDVDYQGARAQVVENSDIGTPLYVDVAVQLPPGVSATFVNDAGLLEAGNLANTLSLITEGGDIGVQNLNGDLSANTSGGDLNGVNLKGEVKLDTGGGDTDLETVTGTLHAATGGGDLHVTGDLSVLSTFYAHTGGGDLRVSGDVPALRDLDVSTSGGDAVLKLDNLSMHLETSASGGDVNVHFPDISGNVVSKGDYFSGDIGKAAGKGTINSSGGDITVSGN